MPGRVLQARASHGTVRFLERSIKFGGPRGAASHSGCDTPALGSSVWRGELRLVAGPRVWPMIMSLIASNVQTLTATQLSLLVRTHTETYKGFEPSV
jgi:hypothetical protein